MLEILHALISRIGFIFQISRISYLNTIHTDMVVVQCNWALLIKRTLGSSGTIINLDWMEFLICEQKATRRIKIGQFINIVTFIYQN